MLMWHYIWQNQQVGPVPEADLRRYFAEGRLPLETMVWAPGMEQWTPAFQVPAFQPGQGQAPPPAAQPAPPQDPRTATYNQVAAAIQQNMALLSPSETVFFHADRFASPAGMLGESVELVTAPQKVKAGELGQAIMAVAFLAAEQAGGIRLAVKEQKGLFGLKTNKVLETTPGPAHPDFPPDSLEAEICLAVHSGARSVSDIVHTLLREDSSVPAALPYWIIRETLVRRGLIQTREQKGLLGSVTYQYFLTDQARQVAASHDPTPLLQLLGQTQQRRLDVWTALAAGIQSGFTRRREFEDRSHHDWD
ncbi:MAG: DUF4339 domain-containing protein [Bacillota bacterium]